MLETHLQLSSNVSNVNTIAPASPHCCRYHNREESLTVMYLESNQVVTCTSSGCSGWMQQKKSRCAWEQRLRCASSLPVPSAATETPCVSRNSRVRGMSSTDLMPAQTTAWQQQSIDEHILSMLCTCNTSQNAGNSTRCWTCGTTAPAMGVLPSSIRSAETSMLFSPPLCTPPTPATHT